MAFEGDKECFQFLASSLGPSASYAEAAAAEAQGSRTSAWLQNDKESLRLALAMLARRHSEQGKADAASPGKASRGVRHPWCYADVAELVHEEERQCLLAQSSFGVVLPAHSCLHSLTHSLRRATKLSCSGVNGRACLVAPGSCWRSALGHHWRPVLHQVQALCFLHLFA